MLKINDLHTYYGNVHALKGVSLEVKQGEIIALIGSNGAGKSTLIDTVIGTVHSKQGTITFKDKDITNVPSATIVKAGISISPEGREVFPALTVEENLRLGAYIVKDKARISAGFERVYELFPRLKERMTQLAGTLSGGEQQMLAMGRALMSHPKIIVMDEPSMGLSPILVNEIFDIIQEVSAGGTTVLLVEQNAKKALSIADRAYVLETGKIVLEGDAETLMNDDSVKKAYLGE